MIKLIFTLILIAGNFHNLLAEDKHEEGALSKLLAPGPLIEAHKKLESSNCLDCHDVGKGIPDDRCLKCHTEINKFKTSKSGFHGLTTNKCVDCHTDHKGRSYDSTLVNTKTFDHNKTGYKLEGKHKNAKCSSCHKLRRKGKAIRTSGIRYMGAKKQCISCHKSDNIHNFTGTLKKKACSECHTTTSWKSKEKQDHFKLSGFKLDGAHKKLSCNACHSTKRKKSERYKFKNLKTKGCVTCHKSPHSFKGSQKKKSCVSCHSTSSWMSKEKFDHFKNTGFKLSGAHARVSCKKCHTGASEKYKFKQIKTKSCLACHTSPHKPSLSKKFQNRSCLSCHTENSWNASSFNHGAITGYKLSGAHARVKCISCHKQTKARTQKGLKAYSWVGLKRDCLSCHKDQHKFGNHRAKRFGNTRNCKKCHIDAGWRVGIKFSHNKHTSFPLTGKHKPLSCNQCHTLNRKLAKKKVYVRNYKFKNLRKKNCNTCHSNPHLKKFSKKMSRKKCTSCHTTSGWTKGDSAVGFDHDDTNFRLTGTHKKLSCRRCHRVKGKTKYKFKKTDGGYCISCHGKPHKKQFSKTLAKKSCDKCHTTKTFKNLRKFDHDLTAFKLKGAHRKVSCKRCHTPTRKRYNTNRYKAKYQFKNLNSKGCATCHRDPHRGANGNSCISCHTNRSWKMKKNYHRNLTLSGVHKTLECSDCHNNGRRLEGLSDNCAVCHQKDDIHSGALPECSDCHSQNYWEATTFSHSISSFPLLGTHRTLECSSCHSGGVYQGKPSECVDCHLKDISIPTSPAHTLPLFEDCSKCHSQFSW